MCTRVITELYRLVFLDRGVVWVIAELYRLVVLDRGVVWVIAELGWLFLTEGWCG